MTGTLILAALAAVAVWWIKGRLRPARPCWLCKGRGHLLKVLFWVPIGCPACKGTAVRLTFPARWHHRRKGRT